MNTINHFVRVDIVWSYNLISNLEGVDDINMHMIDDIFRCTASYLMARHAFHMSGNNIQYNGVMEAMREHLERYTVGPRYFMHCFEALFRMLSPALACIATPIKGVTTISTDTGNIEGFVFAT